MKLWPVLLKMDIKKCRFRYYDKSSHRFWIARLPRNLSCCPVRDRPRKNIPLISGFMILGFSASVRSMAPKSSGFRQWSGFYNFQKVVFLGSYFVIILCFNFPNLKSGVHSCAVPAATRFYEKLIIPRIDLNTLAPDARCFNQPYFGHHTRRQKRRNEEVA